MSQNRSILNRVQPGLFISIFLFLMSLYLATYSGRIESSDSIRVIDAASSQVHFGDLRRDETLWQEAPRSFPVRVAFPFTIYEPREPLIAYATVIPYTIASVLPSIGLVHASWLLNIFIVTLTALLFFYLAQVLNFSKKTSLIATILMATATILWAYSKTLFRDPLVMLFIVIVALCLELWRQDYRRIWWFLLAILAGIGAYYTKNSSIIVIPAFIIWIIPNWQANKLVRRSLDILLITGLVLLTLIAFVPFVFDIFADFVRLFISFDTRLTQTALHSYLFSIGGSILGTSPILLSGLIGAIMLIRQNRRRLVWSILALIVAYALGHALVSRIHWFGGLSLPPRFMTPIIPFVMILTLPVIAKLFNHDRAENEEPAMPSNQLFIGRIFFIGLAIFSIAVQVIFSVSLLDAYVELLPPEANGLLEWLPGLNNVEYLRWRLLPQSWGSLGLDIAWTRINAGYISIGFVVLANVSMLALIKEKYRLYLNSAVLIAVLILTLFGFRQLYQRDEQYWATTPELFDVLAILEEEADAIEPLFLAGSADVTYERFILNYNHLNNVRPVVIGFQPGERTSPSDSPTIESNFTTDAISVTMLRYIDRVISLHDRFWWLAHNGIFTEWAIRPEERFFTENYYLLNEHKTDNPTVRLLEFSSIQAPDRYNFRLPEFDSTIRFGDDISLEGYSLPSGQIYSPGDVVPITYFWQTDTALEADYTVSWFIVHEENGYLRQGLDSVPSAGFSPTNTWEANQLIYDNRAIELPLDAPPGNYQIWLRLYVTANSGEQLLVTAADTYDDSTAILPMPIEVLNTN